MKIKTILVIINIAGIIGSLIWLYSKPDWEPLVTTIGLTGALIAQLFSGKGDKENKTIMTQKGGKGSTNYQSKNDIKINIKNDK
jgi:hypothetical protein